MMFKHTLPLVLLLLLSSFTAVLVHATLPALSNGLRVDVIPIIGVIDPRTGIVDIISDCYRDVNHRCNGLALAINGKPLIVFWPDTLFHFVVATKTSSEYVLAHIDYAPMVLGFKYFNYSRLCSRNCIEFKGSSVINDTVGVKRNVSVHAVIRWFLDLHERGAVLGEYFTISAYSSDQHGVGISFLPLGKIVMPSVKEPVLFFWDSSRGVMISSAGKSTYKCEGLLGCPGVVLYYNDSRVSVIIPQQLNGVYASVGNTSYVSLVGAQTGEVIGKMGEQSLNASGTAIVIVVLNTTLEDAERYAENPWSALKDLGPRLPELNKPVPVVGYSTSMPSSRELLLGLLIGVVIGSTPATILAIYFLRKYGRRVEDDKRSNL